MDNTLLTILIVAVVIWMWKKYKTTTPQATSQAATLGMATVETQKTSVDQNAGSSVHAISSVIPPPPQPATLSSTVVPANLAQAQLIGAAPGTSFAAVFGTQIDPYDAAGVEAGTAAYSYSWLSTMVKQGIYPQSVLDHYLYWAKQRGLNLNN